LKEFPLMETISERLIRKKNATHTTPRELRRRDRRTRENGSRFRGAESTLEPCVAEVCQPGLSLSVACEHVDVPAEVLFRPLRKSDERLVAY
jgi:hypothetical protein